MVDEYNLITETIRRYIAIVKQNDINVERVYLFGSHARGTATEDSDIDIAIISRDFKGDRFDDRRKLIPLRRKIDRRIEPMPFVPEDFNAANPLALEILTHGIEITTE